uniref:Processing and transport protein n=1 Tax=Anatid alphaherpesvirus 2 TaxID=3080522 RepID=A0AAU0K7D6_9ALPH
MLVAWGQVQSYAFQVELLKRCDPDVAVGALRGLKLNALTLRYLLGNMAAAMEEQAGVRLSQLTYALWLTARRTKAEGEALIEAVETYAVERNPRTFFARTMAISPCGQCPYHADVELATYGGKVKADVKYLHDVENVLKQLNYCHLIVRAEDADAFLKRLDGFMLETLGSGMIVPPELYDPVQPCSVCFEELCVTANRGETAHRRMAGKICDHITKQIRVRVTPDEIAVHIPHASGVPKAKRDAAAAALRRLDETMAGGSSAASGRGQGAAASVYEAADAALDSHNVFLPASGKLYAVSELKFWLASSGVRSGGGSGAAGSRGGDGTTVDAFADNLDALVERERAFDMRAAVVELAVFGRRMEHFERVYCREIEALNVADRLMLGGRASSPDDMIEALIKACYDHHLSAPLLKRLADPEKAAEEALKRALEGASNPRGGTDPGSRDAAAAVGDDREITDDVRVSGTRARSIACGDDERGGWLELVRAAAADAVERRKMYADRLTKRSMASLDRCVTEQRRELEKTLRINVYGEVLLDAYVAVYNGFRARLGVLAAARDSGAKVIDNRACHDAFDAHRFMLASLLRRRVDPAMLPSLTHKFFQLVNGPMFDHDRHTFAQPPNTALYFSVENVGLLPHLKEELARFMLNSGGASDWTVSKFRGFYDFSEAEGVTASQRLAWKYIKELILATALFSSVFRCGEIRIRRADSAGVDASGVQLCPDGVYLTYETTCPLVAVLGAGKDGRICPETTIIVDTDVFSLLYSVLQRMAPNAAEKARAEAAGGETTPSRA